MKIDVTLAICVYNGEQYIEETLFCILKQTFQNFNLLIINDFSTDETKHVIQNFFSGNPRQYELVDFDENKGLAAGRHYVETHVETKYILFIDADDRPYPQMVEKLYSKISSDNDLIAVGCYLEFIDGKGKKISGGQFLGDKTKEEFFSRAENKKLIFLGSNAIFNREAANSVGGRSIIGFFDGRPRYQDLCEDLDLWTRMSDLYIYGKAIIVIPEILLQYRKHDEGLSASSLNMVLRMRHIKTNLLLRRASLKEKTFVEFYNSLSTDEMTKLKRVSKAADGLRLGFFFLKERNFLKGLKILLRSTFADPKYVWQKIIANSGIFK